MLPLRLSCREVTRLVLSEPEQPYSLLQRLRLRLHWLACINCMRFRHQADLMRQATGRWRAYRDADDDSEPPTPDPADPAAGRPAGPDTHREG